MSSGVAFWIHRKVMPTVPLIPTCLTCVLYSRLYFTISLLLEASHFSARCLSDVLSVVDVNRRGCSLAWLVLSYHLLFHTHSACGPVQAALCNNEAFIVFHITCGVDNPQHPPLERCLRPRGPRRQTHQAVCAKQRPLSTT